MRISEYILNINLICSFGSNLAHFVLKGIFPYLAKSPAGELGLSLNVFSVFSFCDILYSLKPKPGFLVVNNSDSFSTRFLPKSTLGFFF